MFCGHTGKGSEGGSVQAVRILAVIGDALIFLLFAFIGRTSHREADAGAVTGVLGTAFPSLAGWLTSAVAFDGYAADAFSRARTAIMRTLRVWVIGCIIALAIRSLLELRIVPLTFAAIAFAFNLVLLVAWHGFLATLARMWRHRAA